MTSTTPPAETPSGWISWMCGKGAKSGYDDAYGDADVWITRGMRGVALYFGFAVLHVVAFAMGITYTFDGTYTPKYQYVSSYGVFPLNNNFTAHNPLIATTTVNYGEGSSFYIPTILMPAFCAVVYGMGMLATYILNGSSGTADNSTVYTTLCALRLIVWSVSVSAYVYFRGEKSYLLSFLATAPFFALAMVIFLADVIAVNLKAASEKNKLAVSLGSIQVVMTVYCLVFGIYAVSLSLFTIFAPSQTNAGYTTNVSSNFQNFFIVLVLDVLMGVVNLALAYGAILFMESTTAVDGEYKYTSVSANKKGSSTLLSWLKIFHVASHITNVFVVWFFIGFVANLYGKVVPVM